MTIELCMSVLGGCAEEATRCGPHIVQTLAIIVECIQTKSHCNNIQLSDNAKRCQLLVLMAEEAIASYPFSAVPDCWRRLYMDATLLESISCLSQATKQTEPDLLNLVKRLDMANIVTAYFDEGRRDIFFNVMDMLQSALSQDYSGEHVQRPAKRARRGSSEIARPQPHMLLGSVKNIRRYTVEDAPSMENLPAINEPFIVDKGAAHWPAISENANAWKNAQYLRKVAGRGRIVPIEVGSSYIAEGWSQKLMDFDKFIEQVGWDYCSNTNVQDMDARIYLAQHDLFQQFPALLADLVPPDYVFADMQPPEYFPEYSPPNTLAGYAINAWMGPAGTYSPAHTDPYYNCYVQVVGSKHIWVAPPHSAESMHMQKTRSDEDSENDSEEGDACNAALSHFMDNTATVNVFDDSHYRANAAGAFSEKVAPFAMQAILSEGDLLYMPPQWWHSIRSLSRSFSVSMWF